MGTKEMSNAEFFKCVISVSLNNKGKYFSVIIQDYLCGFLCKYFSVCDFRVFSVSHTHKIQCDFQCNNFIVIPVKEPHSSLVVRDIVHYWYQIVFTVSCISLFCVYNNYIDLFGKGYQGLKPGSDSSSLAGLVVWWLDSWLLSYWSWVRGAEQISPYIKVVILDHM